MEKQTLNEISTRDAFQKFYNGKVDADIFEELMRGQDKMTAFHKICLDLMTRDGATRELQSMVASVVGGSWPSMNEDKKQALIEMSKDGEIEPTIPSIGSAINNVLRERYHTTASAEKDGFQILYQDKGSKLTATYTYAANAHHYGNTEWCTASDIYGENSGWDMYKSYSMMNDEICGVYLQLILTNERGSLVKMFQIVMEADGEFYEAYDEEDHSVDSDYVIAVWNKFSLIEWKDLFGEGMIDPVKLVNRARDCYAHESVFMDKFIKRKVRQLSAQIQNDLSQGKYNWAIEDSIKKAQHGQSGEFDDGVVTSTWLFRRTQPSGRYIYAKTNIYPKNEKFYNFFVTYLTEENVCIISFIEKTTGKIVVQNKYAESAHGLIYGVFGIIMKSDLSKTVLDVINLETDEHIKSDDGDDCAMFYMHAYDKGYIAFGQVKWKIYNVHTGQLLVPIAFDPHIDENGCLSYYKSVGGRFHGEKPTVLNPIPMEASASVNEMKRINRKINLL